MPSSAGFAAGFTACLAVGAAGLQVSTDLQASAGLGEGGAEAEAGTGLRSSSAIRERFRPSCQWTQLRPASFEAYNAASARPTIVSSVSSPAACAAPMLIVTRILAVGTVELRRGNCLPQVGQGPLHVGDRRAIEDQGELFAAVSGDSFAVSQHAPQHAARAAEDFVTRLVPVGIVEPFEFVQVDHGQRERLARSAEFGHATGDIRLEGAAVADQGEGVGAGLGSGRFDQADLLAELVLGLVETALHGLVDVNQFGDDVKDLCRLVELFARQLAVDLADAGAVLT